MQSPISLCKYLTDQVLPGMLNIYVSSSYRKERLIPSLTVFEDANWGSLIWLWSCFFCLAPFPPLKRQNLLALLLFQRQPKRTVRNKLALVIFFCWYFCWLPSNSFLCISLFSSLCSSLICFSFLSSWISTVDYVLGCSLPSDIQILLSWIHDRIRGS